MRGGGPTPNAHLIPVRSGRGDVMEEEEEVASDELATEVNIEGSEGVASKLNSWAACGLRVGGRNDGRVERVGVAVFEAERGRVGEGGEPFRE